MKEYDIIDVAIIYTRCKNITEVIKTTMIFRDFTSVPVNVIREISNKKIRFFINK